MTKSVHSRLGLRTLLKLRGCAAGWFAREHTCWSLGNKTPAANIAENACTAEIASFSTNLLNSKRLLKCSEFW